jgi:hypothetical protein
MDRGCADPGVFLPRASPKVGETDPRQPAQGAPACGLLHLRLPLDLEHINIENVNMLCKDLLANPCHEIVVGGLCPPLSDNFKVNMLEFHIGRNLV